MNDFGKDFAGPEMNSAIIKVRLRHVLAEDMIAVKSFMLIMYICVGY